jgi:membrane protease YdiL (CAAX protease family)
MKMMKTMMWLVPTSISFFLGALVFALSSDVKPLTRGETVTLYAMCGFMLLVPALLCAMENMFRRHDQVLREEARKAGLIDE